MKTKPWLIIFTSIILSSSFAFAAPDNSFNDLRNDHWAYNDVTKMVQEGILSGYDDGTFRPNEPVTREQFAKILALSLKLNSKGLNINSYADVAKDQWSYEYIEATKDYISGYEVNGNTYFKGGNPAKREEVAAAIVKALQLDNQAPDYAAVDALQDAKDVSPEYRKFIAIAIKNGIMEGYGDGYFGPQKTLTRAEVSSLVLKSRSSLFSSAKANDFKMKYKTYEDSFIKFEYPDSINFQEDKNPLYTYDKFIGQVGESSDKKLAITLSYSPFGNSKTYTTISDIYDHLDAVYTSYYTKDKDNDTIVVYVDNSKINIIGKPIGTVTPTIQIYSLDTSKSGDEKVIEAAKRIRQTYKVIINDINLTGQASFSDGNITFNYPKEFRFVIEKTSKSSKFDEYKALLNGIEIKLVYSTEIYGHGNNKFSDTTLNGIYNYFDSHQTVGELNYFTDRYVLLKEGSGKSYYNFIYTGGIDNVVPQIIVIAYNQESGNAVSELTKKKVDEIGKIVADSLSVINSSQTLNQ